MPLAFCLSSALQAVHSLLLQQDLSSFQLQDTGPRAARRLPDASRVPSGRPRLLAALFGCAFGARNVARRFAPRVLMLTGEVCLLSMAAHREPAEDGRFAGKRLAFAKGAQASRLLIPAKPPCRPRPLAAPPAWLAAARQSFGLRSRALSLRPQHGTDKFFLPSARELRGRKEEKIYWGSWAGEFDAGALVGAPYKTLKRREPWN
jgi:hypothetical protein